MGIEGFLTNTKIATPNGWQPGDKVIVLAPDDADAAGARMKEGFECIAWYFGKKDLA